MRQALIIGGIGAAALVAALAVVAPPGRRDTPPVEVSPAVQREPAAMPSPSAAAMPPVVLPSFDAVRVDGNRDAIIAGHAAPGAEVTLFEGDAVLGSTTADGSGAWLIVSDRSLEPGTRELGVAARLPSAAEALLSEDVVLLVLPEPGMDVAGGDAAGGADTRPLVLLMPRDGAGQGRVLQAPAAVAVAVATPPEVAAPGDAAASTSVARPVSDDSAGRVMVVRSGNSLWSIARSVYGEGLHYRVIYEANRSQIGDPDLIYPGQVFMLPERPSAPHRPPP